MSSSMDEFDCPKCGRIATREQDNKTCEVHVSCRCGWSGEEVTHRIPNEYRKIVNGFVAQNYEFINGQYVCVSQEFIAGDEVTRENDIGEELDENDWDEEEIYFSFNMEQPD